MNTTENDLKKPENSAYTANDSSAHQSTNAEKAERLKDDVLDEDETPSYAFGLSLTGIIVGSLLLVAAFYYGIISP